MKDRDDVATAATPPEQIRPDLREAVRQWLEANKDDLRGLILTGSATYGHLLILNQLENPESALSKSAETEALIDLALSIPEFWEINPAEPSVKFEGDWGPEYLVRMAIAHIANTYFHAFSGTDFEGLSQALEEYLFNYPAVSYQLRIELWGITLERSPVNLPPGGVMRHLTAVEQGAGSSSKASDQAALNGTPGKSVPGTILEKQGSIAELAMGYLPKEFGGMGFSRGSEREFRENVLLAIRLLYSGDIEFGIATIDWSNPLVPNQRRDLGANSFRHLGVLGPWDNRVLAAAECDRLEAYWPFLVDQTNPERQKLNVATRRFLRAHQRDELEDQLIDQLIAIESLFADDSANEISHKASQRLARYIGATGVDRFQIFENARDVYNGRSRVVHGGVLSRRDRPKLPKWCADSKDYVRRALLKCMENMAAPRPKDIDKEIMS